MMLLLEWHRDQYAVWRCPVGGSVREHERSDAFAIIRTPDETTIVCGVDVPAPTGIPASGPWRMFRIAGTLPHDAVGILAALSTVLAGAEVPIFAISSFDTDYVLIPSSLADQARTALSEAGYSHGDFE